MNPSKLCRVSGLGLVLGAVVFTVHIVWRSLLTAGEDPVVVAKQNAWVWVHAFGFMGAMLVLMGLPAMYARMAAHAGRKGMAGIALVTLAWTFFGVFLSLYAALIVPWLAERAPALVGVGATLPAPIIVAFMVGLFAWVAGTILLAIPFIRGRLQQAWVGYALPFSGIWMLLGNLVIAPSGPAANLAINLLSNLGPVLFLAPIGYLGAVVYRQSPLEDGRALHAIPGQAEGRRRVRPSPWT